MAALAFTTAARNRETITFDLDGEEYHFSAPKTAKVTMAALKAGEDESKVGGVGLAIVDWLSEGLPDEEAERLKLRLENPDDDFDFPGMIAVANGLLAEVAGRPFGSLPASAGLPPSGGKSSTPEPSSAGSTPSTSPSTDSSAG